MALLGIQSERKTDRKDVASAALLAVIVRHIRALLLTPSVRKDARHLSKIIKITHTSSPNSTIAMLPCSKK